MTQQPTSELCLRDYPDDDALLNPGKYSKALSFSPDIIPLYGQTADESTLCHPASWRGFSGLPIVGGDVNNVYIRGYGSGGPHIASLRAVPSELILWPHVWYNEQPVPSGPVVIPAGDKKGPYVSDGPLHFRPEHCTGYTHSLIAHVYKHDERNKGLPPPPPFDLEKGGVDDFLSFLAKDKTYTFYNVIVADPTLKHVSATTRLRMIGQTPQPIGFRIDSHAGSPLPAGLEVSLVDDRGRINIPRTPLEHFGEKTFLLEPSYNGTLMFNVFAPDGHGVYEPYSGLSLQACKGDTSQKTGFSVLLGSVNIIFEHHGTRNLRFSSHAAHQLRDASIKASAESLTRPGCGPIPVTSPCATGWWTRAGTADTNNFPHHDPIGISPDIQPVGINLGQNFVSILQNPADYTSAHQVKLVGNRKNYFFVRGYSTLEDIDVQARLFAVNASTVNYPSHYVKDGLKARVVGGGGEVNSHCISGPSPNRFYVFERPFEIDNPPDDATHHYCLIAEFRQKRRCCPEFPCWPSENWANYKTLADFENMVFCSPLVCWRNIDWQPCPPRGQKYSDSFEWACKTELCIPECSSYSSFWTIILQCENKVIPNGSKWKLVCDDSTIFPNGICFDDTPLSTECSIMGAHFTGAHPGYKAKVTVTVTWCDNGDNNIPPPCVSWKLALTEPHVSPIKHLAHESPDGHEKWPFHVTEHYPHIGGRPNPSPLPWFEAPGLNKWPHEGAVHFPLGQVRIGAVRE